MKLPSFALARARSADHAVELLADLGEDAKLLAGGQSLIPLMSFRLAVPAQLIDVSELADLRYVRRHDGGLAIGAMTRHAELEAEAAALGPPWRALGDAMPLIGHPPIRTRGTIGGSLAHADATAELPLLARTFDAVVVARSAAGEREIAADRFFRGTLSTDLDAGEMIVEVRLPSPPAGAASAFEEFSERAGDFALAAACVAVARDQRGICSWARIGLGAVASTPIRCEPAETALVGSPLDEPAIDAACQAALDGIRPRAGLHVSAEFRSELAATMLRRALRRAAAAAQPAVAR